MSQTDAAYRFVSWFRRGAAAHLTVADRQAGPAHAALPVSIELNQGAQVATTTLDLVGPGDITAFDPHAIARAWPPPETSDAEANLFPLLELHQSDLPWRYTPRKNDGDGRLRPWCALIVVSDSEMAAYDRARPDRALGAITIAAGTPMPDIAQAWAWVHVQISGDDGTPIATAVASSPERCLSRLLCPRRLQPNTMYWACLVPTFEVGRRAGLRLPLGAAGDTLDAAWSITDGVLHEPVQLPVYYHWRFGTGAAGDFESLVRKLVPAALPANAGLRPLDVSAPGGELPVASTTGGPLALGGALISPSADLGDTLSDTFVDALADLIAIAPDSLAAGGPSVIVPPLYGTWHAQQPRLLRGHEPHWFHDLNQDPRLRVPAALGAAVVQAAQDSLMAAAWEQVDGIREANAQLRWAQLAREVSRRMHVRFVQAGTTDRVLQLVAPIHVRTPTGGATVAHLVRHSPPRSALFSSQFRRIRRARGPIGRRQLRPEAADAAVITNVNAGAYDHVLVATPAKGANLITHEWIHAQHVPWRGPVSSATIAAAPQRPHDIAWDRAHGAAPHPAAPHAPDPSAPHAPHPAPPHAPERAAVDSPSMHAFRTAALALADREVSLGRGETYRRLALSTLRTTLIAATDPRATIPAAFAQRFTGMLTFAWNPPDPIDPVMAYPVFPQPMYAPLAALSQDWMMPGLSEVSANTATLAVTNDAFIEAYLLGLNHEMARELLWNDYPTDQRGSYFRQFWDPAGVAARPTPETAKDITPIETWQPASVLGSHSPRPPSPSGNGRHLVLVVRSEVLRRYPNTVVYAQRAVLANGVYSLGTERRAPVFSGRLEPDLALFGFALGESDARGSGNVADPGWFFVFQEQPHTPQFGLDIGSPDRSGTAPASWDDLAWPHLVDAGHSPDELGYIDLGATWPLTAALEVANGPAWHLTATGPGGSFARGADHAAITQQRPVQVALHASLMLLPRG